MPIQQSVASQVVGWWECTHLESFFQKHIFIPQAQGSFIFSKTYYTVRGSHQGKSISTVKKKIIGLSLKLQMLETKYRVTSSHK